MAITPMMQQFNKAKSEHPDCILFFRMGDFYEMFFEDAVTASRELGITLTARGKSEAGDKIPMAGVPVVSMENYLQKLVAKGLHVAICEQVSETGKGLVSREVVRVVTPSTSLIENETEKKLASLKKTKSKFVIIIFELTKKTAEIKYCNSWEQISELILTENISELLLDESSYDNLSIEVIKLLNCSLIRSNDDKISQLDLIRYKSLSSGIEKISDSVFEAMHNLEKYLKYLLKTDINIKNLYFSEESEFLQLDYFTILNLELFTTIRTNDKSHSVFCYLNRTLTILGSRLLANRLQSPPRNLQKIQQSHESVSFILENFYQFSFLTENLKQISDMPRLLSKVEVAIASIEDILNLVLSLHYAIEIARQLKNIVGFNFEFNDLDVEFEDFCQLSYSQLEFSGTKSFGEGRLIKSGIIEELDYQMRLLTQTKEILAQMEERLKQELSLSSLKIRNNEVFGFYIEISKIQATKAPEYFIRKQTLVNAERFITPELKNFELEFYGAREKVIELEKQFFQDLSRILRENSTTIRQLSDEIAALDLIYCFANLAKSHNLVRPTLQQDQSRVLEIKNGCHPVVKQLVGETNYTPADVSMSASSSFILLTGPNMGGKSVFSRMLAINILLAHIGSFVDASSATIPLIDKLFVRSGASDMISSRMSTFMVEMVECSKILKEATSESLVILDEVGRGTSTWDGLSLAWAITEELCTGVSKPLCVFATHYHELSQLESSIKNLKNYHMAVAESDDSVIFLHTPKIGSIDKSFGLHVAKMAGINPKVLNRAQEVLTNITSQKPVLIMQQLAFAEQIETTNDNQQLPEVINDLKTIDLDEISPKQAWEKLRELKTSLFNSE